MLTWELRVPRKPRKRAAHAEAEGARRLSPDTLFVDDQTLADLEIFAAQGGAPSLFDLLNRTRTVGGTRVLRARFRRPPATHEGIRAVQDSLRHIARHRPPFNLLPGEVMLAGVELYLQSNLSLVMTRSRVGALLEALEVRLADFKEYRETVMGVRRTARMIRTLARLADRPELADAPGELGGRLREMRALLARPALAHLPLDGEGELPWWRIMGVDRVLRRDERGTIERLMHLVHALDALVSMADATVQQGFAFPEVLAGPAMVAGTGVYHPFLPESVRNPLALDQRRRLLFLTGPNMAGKTTYLRACGIAIYLGHLGMGVPATAFRFSPCNALFTAITLADNVREGVSFFRAEALRVKTIAAALAERRRVIALLDEPFKGTNVKDALDASRAVFRRFASARDSIFLVSSHLIEVGAALEATGAVDCRRFEAGEGPAGLEYDFTLRPGISAQRLGMRVLAEEGVFELLDEPQPAAAAGD